MEVEDLLVDWEDGPRVQEVITCENLGRSESQARGLSPASVSGEDGGGGPVHRPGGRPQAAQAAGDHLWREVGQAQQRQDASAQGGKREQELGLPPHQGKWHSTFPASPYQALTPINN